MGHDSGRVGVARPWCWHAAGTSGTLDCSCAEFFPRLGWVSKLGRKEIEVVARHELVRPPAAMAAHVCWAVVC